MANEGAGPHGGMCEWVLEEGWGSIGVMVSELSGRGLRGAGPKGGAGPHKRVCEWGLREGWGLVGGVASE